MSLFPYLPPLLEQVTDTANLFSAADVKLIEKEIKRFQRAFPQFHWRVATANLNEHESPSLFAFWLLNVSGLGSDERMENRPWTILLVILRDGSVALAPGYAAEIWLAADRWGKLLAELNRDVRRRNYGPGVRDFIARGALLMGKAWTSANRIVQRKSKRPSFLS
ncbi:TPM domain-containing protein [Luteolibacter pohnpeiensis]|nr:TPM domain-containing protein [Luteolibacter pohnpeiensis]